MSRVMIVDDEEAILKALQRVLRLAPCICGNKTFPLEVHAFSSPQAALDAARQDSYDLFISDYRMPVMDGIEFLKAAKSMQPDAARLILSGYADLNALVRAVNEVGIDRFIGKPWNDYELMSAIGQALAHRDLLIENRQLANLVRMEMGDTTPESIEAERLESIEPGITNVNWGPDGSVILDPFKLVYYGPAQSGKTTNLLRLHDLLAPELKGEIMTMETKDDRTLFFDLLPLGFRAPSGLLIKFRLFTVPGQIAHDGTRKAVLSRADGVVFVADAERTQETNNAESFQSLTENCGRVGLDFENLPLVVQFNKCDLPGAVPESEIRERWSAAPWPLIFSVALTGQGVDATFETLLRSVYRLQTEALELSTQHALDENAFVAGALGRT